MADLSLQTRPGSRCNLLPLLIPAHTGGIPHTLTEMSSTLWAAVMMSSNELRTASAMCSASGTILISFCADRQGSEN